MASSVWWLYCCYISPCFNKKASGGGLVHFPLNINGNTKRKQPPLRLHNEENMEAPISVQEVEDDGHAHATSNSTRRRQIMLQAPLIAPLIAFSFPQLIMSNAFAQNDVAEDFRTYTDDVNKFKIFIPQDWQVGTGEPNGFKSITAFYPEEAANSNVTIVITGLGPDFTRMESFGKVEAFADTLVSGLDRSWQRPPGVAAKLIDCKAANGLYYIEYTLQNPGESRKHLFSAIGMAFNGWYNRLYTVTGQFVEEDTEKYGSRIEKAVSSFRFI